MINEKMHALGSARSEIREIFEYGLKRKAVVGAENVFDFSLGNPSVPAPEAVTDGLTYLVSNTPAEVLHAYTSAAGDGEVRGRIAEYINTEFGTDYTRENIYMTMGAAAALTASLTSLVSPGEEVIVLSPYFPEYKVFIERCGGVVREVMCDRTTFQPDADAVRAAINEKTAAIIVNSPNNPTGAVYTEEAIKALARVLDEGAARIGKPIYLIADEPYRELVYGGAVVPFLPLYYKNTIVCYSYSKSLSIPGERIGYVLVPDTAEEWQRVYFAVAGAGRALGFVCAPSLLQRLLPLCLGKTSDITVYDRNRLLLFNALSSYGYTVVKPDGAFYLFMKAPCESAREFSEAAKKYDLLLVPSDSFGYGGYVRISYCVTTERIEGALPLFKRLAKDFGLI
jgi:aspartate aminotransferase